MRMMMILAALAIPAMAQVDFSGEWAPRFHEDQPERVPGPELGDYLGLPINAAARQRADTWDASIQTLPEWQCRPHSADYIWRGPSQLRISKEVDAVSRQLTAFHAEWLRSIDRPIYLDGRPRPSEYAPHTWAGFTTAKWDGDILTTTVTHLKEGYIRRNGVPRSDQATLAEHWIRNGDWLTVAAIVTDPVYLTEPFIRTTDYQLDLNQQIPPYPCEVVEEVDRPKGHVPSLLPGTNPFLTEFADRHGLSRAAARGGAETMYPEYQLKIDGSKGRPVNPPAPVMAGPKTAPIDLSGYWVSVVTEDWRFRMVTPVKDDYPSIPLNAEGRRAAATWDPAKDEAAGDQCKAYGAANVMRVPGRLRVSFDNDATMRIDTDAGTQTRLLHFGGAAPAAGAATWQGESRAQWQAAGPRGRGAAPVAGGSLKVVTTHLRPGYLQKNGVPYGEKAVVTEYFNRTNEPNGDSWLILTTVVEDPQFLTQPFVRSTHFKKQADATGWNPTACMAR